MGKLESAGYHREDTLWQWKENLKAEAWLQHTKAQVLAKDAKNHSTWMCGYIIERVVNFPMQCNSQCLLRKERNAGLKTKFRETVLVFSSFRVGHFHSIVNDSSCHCCLAPPSWRDLPNQCKMPSSVVCSFKFIVSQHSGIYIYFLDVIFKISGLLMMIIWA